MSLSSSAPAWLHPPRWPAPVGAAAGLLQALRQEQVPLVIIGSCALAARAPGLLERRPRDVDLLLPPTCSALDGFAATARASGAEVWSWEDLIDGPLFDLAGGGGDLGDPFDEPLFDHSLDERDLGVLAGRWYLRARQGRCVVDATYECPWLPFERALAGAELIGGLPFVAPADQLILNQARGWASDQVLLQRAAARGLHPATASAPYSAA